MEQEQQQQSNRRVEEPRHAFCNNEQDGVAVLERESDHDAFALHSPFTVGAVIMCVESLSGVPNLAIIANSVLFIKMLKLAKLAQSVHKFESINGRYLSCRNVRC